MLRTFVLALCALLVVPASRVCAQVDGGAPAPADAERRAPAPSEPAPAEPAPVESAPVDTRPPEEIAREAYALGEQHYASGEYAEAEAAFIRAYAAVSNPVVLIAIAESRARLERGAAAVEVLERYLRVRPNAADADAVRERIETLRATPGRVQIETTPEGASIVIDGEATGLVTPAEVELPPGVHAVRVELAGYEPVEGSLQIEFATRHQVHQELGAIPVEAPEPEVSDIDEDPEPARRRLSPALVTTMSIAGASLVVGTVLGFKALSLESDFNRMPDAETADRGERYALFADVTFGVTIAATATSVVLYLVTRERAPSDGAEEDPLTPSTEPTVLVAPVLGRGVGGGALTVRF